MKPFPQDNSVASWMDYVSGLPSLGEHWVETSCRRGNPVVLVDTLGARLKARTALTGSLVLARRMAKDSPEQNIGIMLPTTAGGILAGMAGMILGKTLVTLNYTAPLEAMLSAIDQAGLKTVYTSSRFIERLAQRGVDLSPLGERVRLVMLEDYAAGTSTLEKITTLLMCTCLPAAYLKKKFCTPVPVDNTAVILFSSGSEGDPKGVMLSHRNILANVKQVSKILNANPDDVIMANLPLFHSFGLTACQFLPLLERIRVVCHTDPTDVVSNARAIEQHKATLLFGTSSFFRLYVRNNKVSPNSMTSLRLVIAGAEKLRTEVTAAFHRKFNKTIYEGYGCTETAPVAAVNTPFPNLESPHLKTNHKPGTVGKPIPGTELRIADPDTLEPLPVGRAGMIMISGPQVMQGYLGSADKTDRVVVEREGRRWYITGDKGSLDEDGFLSIEDRYARFAKISGEMIGLGLVEEVIRKSLDGADIEIMAVNIPDDRKGEIIITLCTADLDEQAMRPKLLAGGLNNLALPTAYVTVDALPALGSGKPDFTTAKEVARQAILERRAR